MAQARCAQSKGLVVSFHERIRGGDGRSTSRAVMRQDADAMAEIGRLARAGRLEVALGWTLPLEETARAHALAEDSSIGGKVVLTPY